MFRINVKLKTSPFRTFSKYLDLHIFKTEPRKSYILCTLFVRLEHIVGLCTQNLMERYGYRNDTIIFIELRHLLC